MKLVINIPDSYYSTCKDWKTNCVATVDQCIIADGTPLNSITDDVMSLYKKHQSHLATYVYEFGLELNELLRRYEKGGS